MNCENIIKQNAYKLKTSRRDIDIAPDISHSDREKWAKKYASDLSDSNVADIILALSDTSVGSLAITGRELLFDNFGDHGLRHVAFSQIESVSSTQGGRFSPDTISLHLSDGSDVKMDGSVDGLNIDLIAAIINKAIQLSKQGELTTSNQNVSSFQLSERLKVLYFKILCNYAYLNDGVIDSDEYNAIANFIVRMELSGDSRKEIRLYMNNLENREKTGVFLKEVKTLTQDRTGEWDAFRYSIVQDCLYIHNIQSPDLPWIKDGFIGSLMQACTLAPEQIDIMVKAVELNTAMQKKDANIPELKKQWQNLIKSIRYTKGYVPSQFLFCSGSVYGIDSYTMWLKKDDCSRDAINKHRELIMHEIIINTQKAQNILIEDMNDLAERISTLEKDNQRVRAELQAFRDRIKQALDRRNSE